jgi:hypothetical protein
VTGLASHQQTSLELHPSIQTAFNRIAVGLC